MNGTCLESHTCFTYFFTCAKTEKKESKLLSSIRMNNVGIRTQHSFFPILVFERRHSLSIPSSLSHVEIKGYPLGVISIQE